MPDLAEIRRFNTRRLVSKAPGAKNAFPGSATYTCEALSYLSVASPPFQRIPRQVFMFRQLLAVQTGRRWLVFYAGLLLTTSSIVGCGGGSYSDRMEKRIGELKREAPFVELTGPTEIPGTSVKLRVPKIVPNFLTLDTEDASSPTGKINPERVKLLMLKLPGKYCAYNGDVALSDGSKATISCQIAVLEKSSPQVADLPKVLQTAVGGNLDLPWVPINVDTPGGDGTIAWKWFNLVADQSFEVTASDATVQLKKLPGLAKLWWHESDHYHVLLLFKIPKEAEDKVKLLELAAPTAGTVTVGPPPVEEAKPEKS
jgi:hypothetical protein